MKSEDGPIFINGTEILDKGILNGNVNATATRSDDRALAINGTIKILDKGLLDISNNTALRSEDGALYVNGTIKILEKELKAAKALLHSLNDGSGTANPIQNSSRGKDNATLAYDDGSGGNFIPNNNGTQLDVGPVTNDTHLESPGNASAIKQGENDLPRLHPESQVNTESNNTSIASSNKTNDGSTLASSHENVNTLESPGDDRNATEQGENQPKLASESDQYVENNTTSTGLHPESQENAENNNTSIASNNNTSNNKK